MIRILALCLAALPGVAQSEVLASDAWVPLAPPKTMAHAGYMTLTNTGDTTRSLIGVASDSYAMAHLHRSEIKDGVATMSAMHQIDIEPGQSVVFEHGGLHVMLMRPAAPPSLGDEVTIELQFADGDVLPVAAKVMKHGDGS